MKSEASVVRSHVALAGVEGVKAAQRAVEVAPGGVLVGWIARGVWKEEDSGAYSIAFDPNTWEDGVAFNVDQELSLETANKCGEF